MVFSVTLDRVSYKYPYSAMPALRDVSLCVERGKVLSIMGLNGSGKSTLAQIVAGLIQPSSGEIFLNGARIKGKSDLADLRRQVAMLFQNPEDQLFADTVYSDISFGPKKRGVKGSELHDRIKKASETVGLDIDRIGSRSPFSLSGGEKRKAALAGLLAIEPEILVLDEPFTGLDFESKKSLLSALKRFLDENGAGILIVTHNISEVCEISDTYCHLSGGKIIGTWDKRVFASFLKSARTEKVDLSQWGSVILRLAEAGREVKNPLDARSVAKAFIELEN